MNCDRTVAVRNFDHFNSALRLNWLQQPYDDLCDRPRPHCDCTGTTVRRYRDLTRFDLKNGRSTVTAIGCDWNVRHWDAEGDFAMKPLIRWCRVVHGPGPSMGWFWLGQEFEISDGLRQRRRVTSPNPCLLMINYTN